MKFIIDFDARVNYMKCVEAKLSKEEVMERGLKSKEEIENYEIDLFDYANGTSGEILKLLYFNKSLNPYIIARKLKMTYPNILRTIVDLNEEDIVNIRKSKGKLPKLIVSLNAKIIPYSEVIEDELKHPEKRLKQLKKDLIIQKEALEKSREKYELKSL